VIKSIKKLVLGLLEGIYKVISFLNLQLALLVAVVGVVLMITGTFENNPSVLIEFYIALGVSVLLGVIGGIHKLFGIKCKEKTKKAVQIVGVSNDTGNSQQQPTLNDTAVPVSPPVQTGYPKCYAVRQNPKYIMAEYEDKYVLYYKGESGLKKVRTDYK